MKDVYKRQARGLSAVRGGAGAGGRRRRQIWGAAVFLSTRCCRFPAAGEGAILRLLT